MTNSRLRRPRATIISASTLVVIAGGAFIGFSVSGFSAIPGVFGGATVSTIGAVEFDTELAIPPLADSRIDAEGRRVFDIAAEVGMSEFIPGLQTETWGFNQPYLGPTLVAKRGEEILVNFKNDLAEATTVHWHGMHLPPSMDGGPHNMVLPGESFAPTWTLDQPAATLWYHPHPHGATEAHVAMGLAAMFIVQDEVEETLPLPRDYGVDDIPVIIQDARFNETGEFNRAGGFVGALGDQLLVNGTIGPFVDATTDVIRLRIVNASPARIYNFALGDDREFAQIATDGGLLEEPLVTRRVQLSPGERAEILVSLTPGETVVLQSRPPVLGATVPFGGPDGGRDQFDVLEIRAAQSLESVGSIPTTLASIERLDEADVTAERRFVLDGTTINEQVMDMTRIDEVVTVGATEIWSVLNDMPRPHNFHIHDVQFQVASVDGQPPTGQLTGWKDTIYLEPGVEYRLIMRFEDYTDRNMPYMYHCHLLRHEDLGMMGQFVVVKPGETAGQIPASHNH